MEWESLPAKKLKLLLGKGNLVSDTLRETIVLCDDWYTAEPSIATFVLRSLFRDLKSRGWTDQQGVSATIYDPFLNGVLPHLHQIADILSAMPSAEPITEVENLVVAYRDSIRATP